MAERRMVSLKIIDTDRFLEMPATSRLLYYDLLVRADDDGFIASPNKITKMVGASQDDIKFLIGKNFIIPFETGVCVIKDWRVHNYIQSDRYTPTICQAERLQLETDPKTKVYTKCIQIGNETDTQVRLGKDSLELGKGSVVESECVTAPTHKRFTKPTLEELDLFIRENGYNIDPQAFIDFYDSKGWLIGKNPMKDWKAAVRTWARRPQYNKPANQQSQQTSNPFLNIAMKNGGGL